MCEVFLRYRKNVLIALDIERTLYVRFFYDTERMFSLLLTLSGHCVRGFFYDTERMFSLLLTLCIRFFMIQKECSHCS